MLRISISLLAASSSFASAVIVTDSFTGGLNTSFWDGAPFLENDGAITPTNDRLEFTASPAANLFDSNHFAGYAASAALSGNNSWSVDVTAFLAPVNDFGTFGANEAVALTLSIENTNNSQDTLEVSFVAGDPFANGVDKQIRAGIRNDGVDEAELLSGLLGGIGASDLSLNYDDTTEQVTISYDTGGGSVVLGAYDLSNWDFDADKNLTFALSGGAFSTDNTLQSGTIEVLSGEAYFDDLVVNTNTRVPEPSTMILGSLGLFALLRHRR